jgi:SAM-dependent methyltransferase
MEIPKRTDGSSAHEPGTGIERPPSALAALTAMSDLETAMAIRVAATLRLADLIASGVNGLEQLAARSGAHQDALRRLLRYLACRHVLTITADGSYALTARGECLLDAHPSGLRARLDLRAPVGRDRLAFAYLLEAVLTGEPVHERMFGRPFYAEHSASGLDEAFDHAMAARSAMRAAGAMAGYDWTAVQHVIDVGGGTGVLLAAILRAIPTIHGTLVDQPATAARARRALAAAGVADRCEIAAGSIFEPLPAGGDVYLLSSILHDWPDDQAQLILRRCAEAAGPGGRVLIMGRVPSGEEMNVDHRGDPAWLDWTDLDLFMLVSPGGRERTLGEYRSLAAGAGMSLRLLPIQMGPNAVMECIVDAAHG